MLLCCSTQPTRGKAFGKSICCHRQQPSPRSPVLRGRLIASLKWATLVIVKHLMLETNHYTVWTCYMATLYRQFQQTTESIACALLSLKASLGSKDATINGTHEHISIYLHSSLVPPTLWGFPPPYILFPQLPSLPKPSSKHQPTPLHNNSSPLENDSPSLQSHSLDCTAQHSNVVRQRKVFQHFLKHATTSYFSRKLQRSNQRAPEGLGKMNTDVTDLR